MEYLKSISTTFLNHYQIKHVIVRMMLRSNRAAFPMKSLAFLILMSSATAAYASSPCDALENSVTAEVQAAWELRIAKQLEFPKVDYVRSFHSKDCYIILVRPYQSDDVYVFVHGDPLHGRIVTDWGGLARMDEGPEIRRWVLKEARGIPKSLASCFVSQVIPRP